MGYNNSLINKETGLLCTLGILLLIWITPYYIQRRSNYDKQMYVINTICTGNLVPSEIQINKMTYDGMLTNCSNARVFVATPMLVGAIMDAYNSSPFYILANADSWAVRLVYISGALMAFYKILQAFIKDRFNNSLLNKFSEKKPGILEAEPNIDGKKRVIVSKK